MKLQKSLEQIVPQPLEKEQDKDKIKDEDERKVKDEDRVKDEDSDDEEIEEAKRIKRDIISNSDEKTPEPGVNPGSAPDPRPQNESSEHSLINLALIKKLDLNINDPTNTKQRMLCDRVSKDSHLWSLEHAVPRAARLLRNLKDSTDTQPDSQKKVPKEIQLQVYIAKGADSKLGNDLSRITSVRNLAQIATTINRYEAKNPKQKGRGDKSEVYDLYVEAAFTTHEQFLKYAAEHPEKIKSRRKYWQRCKEGGQKVLELIEWFGTGILVALPDNVKPAMIFGWTHAYMALLHYALSEGPKVQEFEAFCAMTDGWIQDLAANKLETIPTKKADLYGRYARLINDEETLVEGDEET